MKQKMLCIILDEQKANTPVSVSGSPPGTTIQTGKDIDPEAGGVWRELGFGA
jgi:hypothetical protein